MRMKKDTCNILSVLVAQKQRRKSRNFFRKQFLEAVYIHKEHAVFIKANLWRYLDKGDLGDGSMSS